MERLSITIVGRLSKDPRLGETSNGTPVVTMSVAVEPRKDGPTRWFTVRAYRRHGENAAVSFRKGDRVMVKADDVEAYVFQGQNGEPRAALSLTAYEIAATVLFDTIQTGRAAAQADNNFGTNAAEAADLSVIAGTEANSGFETEEQPGIDVMAGVNGR